MTSSEVNYSYFVYFVQQLAANRAVRVLDYGCGAGEIVSALRDAGIDCIGCEVFYKGAAAYTGPVGEKLRLLMDAGHVLPIEETGSLPFQDGEFDIVLANHVFEHVRDLPTTLDRIVRVLNAEGRLCLNFPSREVLREGHIGIPLAHWFAPGSTLRYAWTASLRSVGLGHHKGTKSIRQWSRDGLEWIDTYCFYRPYTEIRQELDRLFDVRHNEIEYIRFRARHLPLLRSLFSVEPLRGLWEWAFRRVGFLVLVLRKHPTVGKGHQHSSS